MNIPRNNLFLIAVSVGLAVVLWVWVAAEERSEIIVSVPLEYRNLPRGYEISSRSELLSKVNVWVRGGSANIKNLQANEISAWLDLNNSRAGEQLFTLNNENVRVPYGLTVLRITPSQVAINIEEIIRKMVPVVPRLEGRLAEGFAISQKTATPAQVEVIGPKSAVNTVREAVTDAIDVSSLNTEQVAKVKVGVENSVVRLGSVREVSVQLRVVEVEDILTLKHVPVETAKSERTLKINPRTVRVDLRAPRSILATVTEGQVRATVEIANLNPGMYELTPKIEFGVAQSNKITVQNVSPARIRVRIQ